MNGFLAVNKPGGYSSRVVVNRVGTWFPKVKVGHTGTLDPFATGVLILALGSGTRLVEYVQRMSKSYRAVFHLGATSDTDDPTGVIEAFPEASAPTRTQVQDWLAGMIGEIDQVPPEHSAVWVEGKRAYQLARKGHEVELASKRVRIDDIQIFGYDYPRLELDIHCGKGTYIRSLARDLGRVLGCGAYVEALCRTRIGAIKLEKCLSTEIEPREAHSNVLPLTLAIAELPQVKLSDPELLRLLQGQLVPPPRGSLTAPEGSDVAVLYPSGDLHCIAAWREGRLKPLKVFAPWPPLT